MSPLAARWLEARLALALLTRLPVGRLPEDLPPTGDAAWAFPLVGALIGLLTGLVYVLTAPFLPGLTAALVTIGVGLLLTGALHEDGLADVADGFGGGTSREIKLQIMRDSQVGSYGVVTLVVVLGFIASTMAYAPAHTETLRIFVAIGMISRAAMLVPMATLAPARPEGLGHGATLGTSWRVVSAGVLAICGALIAFPMMLLAAFLAAAAMTFAAKRQIGGQTGDVLGATQKLAEAATWGLVAAYIAAS